MERPHYQDQPEAKPFPVNVTHENKTIPLHLTIGNCAIALFRHRPDMDYLAVQQGEDWIFMFDKHPLVYWMGALALYPEGQRELRLMERKNGRFYDRYRWNADVVIEDYPNQNEIDVYVNWEIGGAMDDVHKDLNDALKEDLDEAQG